jgi:methylated-DNA-protein-cysteine methyltransferase-like protein
MKKKGIKKTSSENSFFDKVYDVARLVPHGKVTSYGAIAKYLGTAGSSRMVGWAMNACHHSEFPVPAHRVVNRIGLLTGKHHFGSPDMMQELLESEGVEVENDKVINFEKLFWDPVMELKKKRASGSGKKQKLKLLRKRSSR